MVDERMRDWLCPSATAPVGEIVEDTLVRDIMFSPDAQFLVAVFTSGNISLFPLDGEETTGFPWREPARTFSAPVFSPDGQLLLSSIHAQPYRRPIITSPFSLCERYGTVPASPWLIKMASQEPWPASPLQGQLDIGEIYRRDETSAAGFERYFKGIAYTVLLPQDVCGLSSEHDGGTLLDSGAAFTADHAYLAIAGRYRRGPARRPPSPLNDKSADKFANKSTEKPGQTTALRAASAVYDFVAVYATGEPPQEHGQARLVGVEVREPALNGLDQLPTPLTIVEWHAETDSLQVTRSDYSETLNFG
jgi:hypothetical protein